MAFENITSWPFVGRERELRRIVAALAQPAGAGLMIAGPPGVGKSRLAAEAAAIAARAGFDCRRVLGTRAAKGIPYGALAPLLRDHGSDTLSAVAEVVATSDERTLLLVVDDAHLLDEASAAVVHQLAASRRAFVVVTVRTGEASPDPLQALWKDGTVDRLDLGPLPRPDHDRLLDELLCGPIDGACRRDLWEASQGNVLFLRELLLGAVDHGILRRERGLFRLTRTLASTPRLVELVESRLVDTGPAERELLELLALGEPIAFSLLTSVADTALLPALERQGLVATVVIGDRLHVRLAHPLHGEVLRQRMSKLTQLVLCRRLADASTDDGDLVQVAVWRLDGGGAAPAGLMLAAARRAYDAGDLALAERLASATTAPEADLLLARVYGRWGRQRERAERLDALDGLDLPDDQRAAAALERSAVLAAQLADPCPSLAAAEASVAPGPWRDELRAERALRELPEEALRLTSPLLESPDGRVFVRAATAVSLAWRLLGRFESAASMAERASTVRRTLADPIGLPEPGFLVALRAAALVQGGSLEARSVVEVAYDEAVAARCRVGQAWCAAGRALVAVQAGALVDAAHLWTEAAAVFSDLGEQEPARWCLANLAITSASVGDVRRASAVLELAGPASTVDLERARAWVLAAEGQLAEAVRRLRSLAEGSARAVAAVLWHDCVRLGDAALAAPALATLAEVVDGDLLWARALHAEGVAGGDAGVLVAAADRFEALGATLFAAEASAAAAATYRRGAQSRTAQSLAGRSRALVSRCQRVRTPALDLAGPGAVLTAREREIAGLAARGLTSSAIAGRLTLSVRTVESHLQRTYSKLGVTSRHELADSLSAC
ncbi:LuxR C-terminal-related transcriptional regulator [Tenggerimyces flavus]|uniref:LuxR C-terminal-related transcriptional regulator n=1 Tax=Tenggerimyces flavus TaxID=1708749 RepID=A0ABV7Y3F0_9ACTN|nr:LuxR family transcriptional regulator [Tenggerimyces flavus]MBM7790807.1 DNA-binding CsgD family transcriptional regulator [Tenggerimyces flavus]